MKRGLKVTSSTQRGGVLKYLTQWKEDWKFYFWVGLLHLRWWISMKRGLKAIDSAKAEIVRDGIVSQWKEDWKRILSIWSLTQRLYKTQWKEDWKLVLLMASTGIRPEEAQWKEDWKIGLTLAVQTVSYSPLNEKRIERPLSYILHNSHF